MVEGLGGKLEGEEQQKCNRKARGRLDGRGHLDESRGTVVKGAHNYCRLKGGGCVKISTEFKRFVAHWPRMLRCCTLVWFIW